MTTKPQSTTTKLEGSEPTLEPCPFCGTVPTLTVVDEHLAPAENGYPIHLECSIDCLMHQDHYFSNETVAEKHWNTRARVSANGVPTVDDAWAKTAAEKLNEEGWLLAEATSEELDKVAAIIQASVPSGSDDLISRAAAKAALCYMCAKPDRYKPAQPIEGSMRLFHFQGSENWNAGQCFAQAVNSVPAFPAAASPVGPTVDRAAYSELIHVAAELARGDGFLSTCAEDLNPRLKRADILKTAERQEERLKDWAYRIRQVADNLSRAASPVAPDDDKATPLCPVHQRLEDADALECEIGDDCVACSLNERRALLELIAPFAAEGNTEDSVTVLSRVVEFYKTHVGDNRVVVSYPAPAAASPVAPQQSDQRMFAPPAEDKLHIAICNAVQSDQFTASDILRQALIDYQPTKLTRTELIRVQQRSGSGEVTAIMVSRVPAPSAAIQNEAQREDHDSCSHWREGDSDNCVWCGDDLGPTTEADVRTTVPSSTQARAAARAIASALERDEVPHHVEESEPFIAAIIERCLSEREA